MHKCYEHFAFQDLGICVKQTKHHQHQIPFQRFEHHDRIPLELLQTKLLQIQPLRFQFSSDKTPISPAAPGSLVSEIRNQVMNYLSRAREGYPIRAQVYFLPIASATISALMPTSGSPPPGCAEPPTQNKFFRGEVFLARINAERAPLLEVP